MLKFLLPWFLFFNIFAKEKVTSEEQKQMIEVLAQNEKVFESYFEYDAKKIEAEVKTLIKNFNLVKSEKFKTDLNRALKFLSKISKDSDREDNNKNYHLSSSFLIKLMNKYDFGPKYQPYYCPMVKKKWIQNVEVKSRVHNPYDPSMPHCGGRL